MILSMAYRTDNVERGIFDCMLGICEYANISLFHNKIENLCSTYRARWLAWNSIVHAIYSCGVNSLPVSQPAHHTLPSQAWEILILCTPK